MKALFLKPWMVQSHHLFKALEPVIKEGDAERTFFDANSEIYSALKPEKCYILLSGELTLSSLADSGESFEIGKISRGGVFGVVETQKEKRYRLFVNRPSTVVISELLAVKMKLSEMKHTLPFRSGWFGKKIQIPSAPLLGVDSTEGVFYLLSFIADNLSKEGGIKVVKISPSRLSKLSGIKREIVTLAMARLEKRGWIDIRKGNIIIKK